MTPYFAAVVVVVGALVWVSSPVGRIEGYDTCKNDCRRVPGRANRRACRRRCRDGSGGKAAGGGGGGDGGGGGGGGGTCKVSYYTDDPAENDGYTTTADGSKLDHNANIVAVPTGKWSQFKGRTVQLDGKTYTVKDSCSVCESRGVSFDILVGSKTEANKLGIRQVPCSWNPLKG